MNSWQRLIECHPLSKLRPGPRVCLLAAGRGRAGDGEINNMKPWQQAFVIPLAALWFVCTSSCYALLWRPSPNVSWSATSPDGRYVFANVSQLSIEKQLEEWNGPHVNSDELEQTIRGVQGRFPVTGMYVNDGSSTPIWTTQLPVYRGKPSSDGKRLVAWGEGAGSSTSFDLINVYEANGAFWEISKEEVVPLAETVLRRLLGPVWESYDSIKIIPAGDRVTIGTDCGDVFDVSLVDRKVLKRHTLPNTLRIVIDSWRGRAVILALAVILFVVVWQFRSWRRQSRTSD